MLAEPAPVATGAGAGAGAGTGSITTTTSAKTLGSSTLVARIVTDPPGVEVLLHRYELQHRRLVPFFERSLGRTPIAEVTLERGSYLCILRHEGYDDVRYPVNINRQEHWDGIAPGEKDPHPIRLPKRGELGKDDCYVPAGWFWSGQARAQR